MLQKSFNQDRHFGATFKKYRVGLTPKLKLRGQCFLRASQDTSTWAHHLLEFKF